MNTGVKKIARRGNGEGTIYRRKDGTWCGMVTVGRKADGNLDRKTFYGRKRGEVNQKIIEFRKAVENAVIDEKITLGGWLDIWMAEYKRSNLRENTIDSYLRNIRIHIKPALGHIPLYKLTLDDVQLFINTLADKNKSTALIRKIRNILHGAIEKAIIKGLINHDATLGLELPEHKQEEIRVLSMEETKRFFKYAEENQLGCAFKLAYLTGMRSGELLALSWDDVDLENGKINISKTLIIKHDPNPEAKPKTKLVIQNEPKTESSRRTINMSKKTLEMLKRQKEIQETEKRKAEGIYTDNNLVFCTSIGTLINLSNFRRSFNAIAKNANIDGASPHSLRHTFATRLFEQKDVKSKTVSALLGHKKVAHTLDIYTRVEDGVKLDAVEKLDDLLKNE